MKKSFLPLILSICPSINWEQNRTEHKEVNDEKIFLILKEFVSLALYSLIIANYDCYPHLTFNYFLTAQEFLLRQVHLMMDYCVIAIGCYRHALIDWMIGISWNYLSTKNLHSNFLWNLIFLCAAVLSVDLRLMIITSLRDGDFRERWEIGMLEVRRGNFK